MPAVDGCPGSLRVDVTWRSGVALPISFPEIRMDMRMSSSAIADSARPNESISALAVSKRTITPRMELWPALPMADSFCSTA